MNNLGNIIFYPSWEKHEFQKITSGIELCACFLFKEQADLALKLKDFAAELNVFFLSNIIAVDSLIATIKKFDRIIFITQTSWSYDANYEQLSCFLDFLKIMQQVGHIKLDIVSVKSIVCPLYGTATHPIDGVIVGLGQTFAQEVDFPVRVLVLEHLSDKNFYWVMNGVLPERYPIIIQNNHFLIPQLKRNSIYNLGLDFNKSSIFLKKGMYLIIGGKGGLGNMMARYLANKYQANLILVGRSQKDEAQIDYLIKNGATSVKYEQLDISDCAQVKNLFERYTRINGIIHSALVLKDSLIINMSKENLLNVLSPKLQGSLNLLRVLKDSNCTQLDFILFFSSIQSYIANPGQGNYTAACVAKDVLASNLSELYMLNAKIINWSFWGDIGIVASDYYRNKMKKLGIESIREEEGLKIIEWFLTNKLKQITVIKASDNALKRLNIEV